MRNMPHRKIVGAVILLIIVGILGVVAYKRAIVWWTASERVIMAKAEYDAKYWEHKTATIERNDNTMYALSVGAVISLLGTITLGTLAITTGKHREMVRRASVFFAKIGRSEVPVHYNDLNRMGPVLAGLTAAEQMYQINAGQAEALRYCKEFAEISKTMAQGRTLPAPQQELQPAGMLAAGSTAAATPAFADLLRTGDLAPGRPMILGYENGIPRRGSFLDIYSAAVAGESGSGKTATLLFLIGSALVSMPVRFVGIDPHYPHPKSLGFKLKPLWKTGLMQMATYKDDMLTVLQYVERTIDNRLKQRDTDETPVVLVIDELAFLSTTSIGGDIARTMERISMEGRKCAVYMLASSQTWLTAKTGNSSTVRDTLTSAYVHRIKPKQANLLLQDKEETEKVKKHVKHAGEALLVPVGDESAIVKMPFTTAADMHMIAEMIGRQKSAAQQGAQTAKTAFFAPGLSFSNASTEIDEEFERIVAESEPAALPEADTDTIFDANLSTEYAIRVRTKALLKENVISYGDINRETGIPQSTAHNWIKQPEKHLKPEQKEALKEYLEQLEQAGGSLTGTGVNGLHEYAVNA